MDNFWDEVYDLVGKKDPYALKLLIEKNRDTHFQAEDTILFSRRFASERKLELKGSININGSGGSHIRKPNLSSIAAMYLATITKRNVVKTGSVASTGIYGSSDFFHQLGLTSREQQERCLKKYHFAYIDFLELSPWKQYKPILRINSDLDRIFYQIVYFDYPASEYFLGISKPYFHDSLANKLTIENAPEKLITYYTETPNGIVDKMMPGKLYTDGQFLCQVGPANVVPEIVSREEIYRINRALLHGEYQEYWTDALTLNCSFMLWKLGFASTMNEGAELCRKAFQDRALDPLLNELDH